MKHLSSRELRILRLLANGENYDNIKKTVGITLGNIHATCWLIRKKTGIKQTRDMEECRNYLRQLRGTKELPPSSTSEDQDPKLSRPTPRQMEVLRLLATGKTTPEIAQLLAVCPQSVLNYASLGAKRAGLDCPPWKRTQAIKEWLAQREPELFGPMADPMF